jgi:hypothetical protein
MVRVHRCTLQQHSRQRMLLLEREYDMIALSSQSSYPFSIFRIIVIQ